MGPISFAAVLEALELRNVCVCFQGGSENYETLVLTYQIFNITMNRKNFDSEPPLINNFAPPGYNKIIATVLPCFREYIATHEPFNQDRVNPLQLTLQIQNVFSIPICLQIKETSFQWIAKCLFPYVHYFTVI